MNSLGNLLHEFKVLHKLNLFFSSISFDISPLPKDFFKKVLISNTNSLISFNEEMGEFPYSRLTLIIRIILFNSLAITSWDSLLVSVSLDRFERVSSWSVTKLAYVSLFE